MRGIVTRTPALLVTDRDYRMLVLDLDGTLLDRRRRVDWRDVEAAARLRDRGVHVTIATGRLFSGTRDVARRMGISSTVACMNGSEMLHSASGEVLRGNYMPNETLDLVRRTLARSGVATVLFASQTIHRSELADAHMRQLRSWSQYFTEWEDIYSSSAWERARDILAVVAVGTWTAIRAVSAELEERLDLSRFELLSFPSPDGRRGFMMVRDNRENKGSALRNMATELGIREDQCVCVGDWMNDIPMLQSGALSFAMGGSPDWLQAAADEVATTRITEGGIVAELAEKVWGIAV